MIFVFIFVVLGYFVGRIVFGGLLTFIFIHEERERERPNTEHWLGWLGGFLGMAIVYFIYIFFF